MRKILGAARHLYRRLRDRAGQGTVEYFMIIGAIAILVGVAVFSLGGKVGGQVVLSQNCVSDLTSAASAATSSTFTGSGPCA